MKLTKDGITYTDEGLDPYYQKRLDEDPEFFRHCHVIKAIKNRDEIYIVYWKGHPIVSFIDHEDFEACHPYLIAGMFRLIRQEAGLSIE